jgi:hypothetical protein
MVPGSAHSGHFFGLHLPSLVAPHFSHLNSAILSSFDRINLQILFHESSTANEVQMFLGDNNNHVNGFCQPFDNYSWVKIFCRLLETVFVLIV